MGEIVYGDRIQVGDIESSAVAIGAGAQVIIQQAQSSVDIARQQAEQDRLILARNVQLYVEALVSKAEGIAGESLLAQEFRQPFKSLYAYTLADAGCFYGRQSAVRDLLRVIGRNMLTVLHGDSGVGKTSILQAGLSPHLLANSHLPIIATIRRRVVSEEIKRTLLSDLELFPFVSAMSLRGFLREVQNIVGLDTAVVLILDQFESLFSSVFSEQIRQHDFDELRECMSDPTLNIRIIISTRDDMFGKLASFESDVVKPYENHYLLSPLTSEGSQEIIVGTAADAGITYELGLVEEMLADFGTADIAPAQLQIVLSTLVDQLLADQDQITYEHYRSVGGVSGVLTHYLASIKAQLVSPDREIAQATLESLIGSERRRDAKTFSQLREEIDDLGLDATRLDRVLDFLLRKRIISPVRIGELADTYAFEIVHDYIAEQVKISPEAQAKKAARDLLDRRMIDYRQFGSLLEPDELRILEPQLAYFKVAQEEQSLIRKSKAEASKRRLRRIVLLAALVFFPVLLVVIWLQAEVRVAEQRISYGNTAVAVQKTADSEVVAATQALGVLALVQETQEADLATVRAQSVSAQATRVSAEKEALLNSIVATRLSRAQSFGIGPDPEAALVFGSAIWIAQGSTSSVSVLNIHDGSSVASISMPDQPNSFLYVNGQIWISANTRLVVVDASTQTVSDSFLVAGRAGDLAYDGEHIWISNLDGVTCLDPQSREVLQKIPLPEGAHKLEFDGEYLWVSSYAGTSLFALDLSSKQVAKEWYVPEPISDLMFDGEVIWVTTSQSGLLRGFDPTTLEISKEYSIGHDLSSLAHDGMGLWVADYVDNALLSLDNSTGEILGRYRVGRGPVMLAFDGQRMWSLNRVDRSATVIPLQFPVSLAPAQLAYDHGVLWLIDQRSPRLIGVDENTGTIVGDYELSDTPISLAVHDHGVWLALKGSQQIVAVNPAGVEVDSIALFSHAIDGFLLTDALAWVASEKKQELSAVDLQSGAIISTYSIEGDPALLTNLGESLWVATQDTHQLIEITLDRGVISSFSLSGFPVSIASDEDRNLLWLGIAGANVVHAVDPVTGHIETSISLSYEPRALLVDSKNLWIAGSDTVSKVNIDRQEELMQYRVGRGVLGMVFGQNRVWIASFTDKTVEYIALDH